MSAAAILALRRRRLVRRLRRAGATDPEHAVTPEELGQRRSRILGPMIRNGVLVPTTGGRFYLDEHAARTFLHRQRVRALSLVGLTLLVAAILWLLGSCVR